MLETVLSICPSIEKPCILTAIREHKKYVETLDYRGHDNGNQASGFCICIETAHHNIVDYHNLLQAMTTNLPKLSMIPQCTSNIVHSSPHSHLAFPYPILPFPIPLSHFFTTTSLHLPPDLTPTLTETSTPHCLDISSATLAASCCSVSAAKASLPPISVSSDPSWERSVESLRRLSMEDIMGCDGMCVWFVIDGCVCDW
jgi:hypothetical protein